MICVVSLIVFSFLGIFSAKYRGLARQAFRCVLDRGTENPCEVNIDREIKNKVVGKAMDIDIRLASFMESHFFLLSSIFLIMLIGSMVASGMGIYNWIVHGNCQGAAATGGCALDQGASFLQQAWETVCFWN